MQLQFTFDQLRLLFHILEQDCRQLRDKISQANDVDLKRLLNSEEAAEEDLLDKIISRQLRFSSVRIGRTCRCIAQARSTASQNDAPETLEEARKSRSSRIGRLLWSDSSTELLKLARCFNATLGHRYDCFAGIRPRYQPKPHYPREGAIWSRFTRASTC